LCRYDVWIDWRVGSARLNRHIAIRGTGLFLAVPSVLRLTDSTATPAGDVIVASCLFIQQQVAQRRQRSSAGYASRLAEDWEDTREDD
jgi:hypothetical protein